MAAVLSDVFCLSTSRVITDHLQTLLVFTQTYLNMSIDGTSQQCPLTEGHVTSTGVQRATGQLLQCA